MSDLKGQTVVITGASSGIGRAAARAFARRGANVVLAARRETLLQELAGECGRLGGRAIAVRTDVTDPAAVANLARAADEAFGGVDIWINNAGTGVFGPYQNAALELHRKTVEVNLFGAMHGAYAVLPIFLRQGRGIIINNISLGGWAPAPYAAAYTASKFGLRGFSASLRQELDEYPDIHVCAVFPALIDTPGLFHAANVSDRQIDPGPMLYDAEDVARTFLELAANPRDEVAVGWPARAAQAAYSVAPRLTERVTGALFRLLLSRAHEAPRTRGALLAPVPFGREASGGWRERKGVPPAGTISRAAGLTLLAVGGLMLARVAAARSR